MDIDKTMCLSFIISMIQASKITLPENNVPSLVSFPGLNQCKVSSDGFFHDVVSAVEFSYLIKKKKKNQI